MHRSALALAVLVQAATAARAAPVRGFADYHLHQMGSLAFGGKWIWGGFDGPQEQALRACSGHGQDHGFLAGAEGGIANLGSHGKNGFPQFHDWPTWDSISHQQSHADWLRKAHADGLTLIVMSAVEQGTFCNLIPSKWRAHGCDDFESVKGQLAAARAFAAHNSWYAIVQTPQEARAAINGGKLAVVLAVEAGEVFGRADFKARLADLYALGVRSLQPVHETDNRFGGAAWHDPPLFALEASYYVHHPGEALKQAKEKLSDLLHKKKVAKPSAATAAKLAGFNLDSHGRNLKGLSAEGKALVGELIARKMVVDVSHLSERAIADTFEIAKQHGYYPLFNSHAHFSDAEPTAEGEWSYSLAPYRMIAETAGVVGVRSSSTASRTYAGAHVANDCDGSVKSFAQRVAWASRELKLDVGFASDFGGFASNLSPRFGPEACADATSAAQKGQRAAQKGATGRALDQKGFAHVGLFGEVLGELQSLGADTSALQGSSEAFIRMWERAADPQRAKVAKVFDEGAARAALR
jgi:microsomal dipeptidase-like Zn-dependent dipeptidase